MRTERFEFPGAQGLRLSARLDSPEGPPRATALFAHCFTCSKDSIAAARIAQALTRQGIAVLRFDFSGLGSSEGEFANTDFTSNVADLLAAAAHLRARGTPPALLIGHSLGGAAVLVAAGDVPEARAVCTIAAPADPGHVTHLFSDSLADIRAAGEADVTIAGRTFRVRQQFLDDIAQQRLTERVGHLHKALLIFHAPTDTVVGIENAAEIYRAARHPKSFIALDQANHLLTRRADAEYVAAVLSAWASRYLEVAEPEHPPEITAVEGAVVVRGTGRGTFQQLIAIGPHRLIADEPVAAGGADTGPAPYDLVLAGLGACTAMTVRMFAGRKGWPLEDVEVVLRHGKIHAEDCADCETREGRIDEITRDITFTGELDETQRAKLLEIADKCPVHRTLHAEVKVRTAEVRD